MGWRTGPRSLKLDWGKGANMQILNLSLLASLLFAGNILAADDAAQILKTTEQTYQALTSYEFKGVTTSETKVGTSVSKTETSFAVAFKTPNEFLLEYDYPSAGNWVRASDGKTMWNKRSITKEFTATPADDDAVRTLDGSPIAAFANIAEGVQNPTVAGSEPVTIGSQSFDCYVVRFQRASGAATVPVKLWIDKTRHLILKQVSGSDDARASATSTENQRTISFTEAAVNGTVSDDLFHLSKK
jgi:outer membrane lipoprotein-sorting protein